MINKIAHHSFSSISKFINCPFSWWSEKVLDRKMPSSAAASFGSQFDQLVADKLGLTPTDTRGDDTPISEQVLVEGVEEAADAYLLQPWAVKKGEATSAQKKIYITPEMWAMFGEMLGLSLEIQKPILGYMDLVKRVGVQKTVIDLKTSKRKGMRVDWALQILEYALAEQAPAGEIHLMTTTKTPAFYRYPIIVSDDTKRWAMTYLTYYINMIERVLEGGSGEGLPRKADYWCNWCAENLECTAKEVSCL